MSYAARTKYDEPGRAERYAARSARRDAEEWALLERALARLGATPPASALDVPCGTGRVAARLIEAGLPTHCADLSPAMRAATEARLAGVAGYEGVLTLDLEAIPEPAPLTAPLVVCFRLLHHLPTPAHRGRVLRGLAALTRSDVLLSFHHPVSVHNLARRLRRLVGGPRGDRHTIRPARLAAEAAAAGLELVGLDALARYRRELWVAHLRRRSPVA